MRAKEKNIPYKCMELQLSSFSLVDCRCDTYNGVIGIFSAPTDGISVLDWVIRLVSAAHAT